MAKHYLDNMEVIRATGIAPGVGFVKGKAPGCMLEEHIRRELRIKDLQQYLKRFKWNGWKDIVANDAERMLYYRSQLILFYMDNVNDDGSGRYFLLPYALDGEIDPYGRFIDVTPVPFANGKVGEDGKEKPWIQGLRRRVIYDLDQFERLTDKEDKTKYCVILRDFSCQLSQNNLPRSVLQESLIGYQAEILPIMRTSLINSAGVSGVRVTTQDEQSNVKAANASKIAAAKSGEGWIPVIGQIDFQDLNTSSSNSPTDLLQAYQAVDNCRAGFMGAGSGEVFQKNAHELQAEHDGNNKSVEPILEDSLDNRKTFCELANAYFGLNLTVDVGECCIEEEQPEEVEVEEEQAMEVEE